MKLFNIAEYGIFDTDLHFPGRKKSEERVLTQYQIEYLISCTGTAHVNGQAYPLTPDRILCTKPGQTRHSDFGFRCYYIHFTLPEGSEYEKRWNSLPDFYHLVKAEIYRPIFASLANHLLSDGVENTSDLLTAKLLELLYYLEQDRTRNLNYLAQPELRHNPFLPRVTAFIEENHMRPLTLEEMARTAGYSPHYFHKIFSSVMGMTPGEYLLSIRIKKAKEALIRTDKGLAQIAYDCGFASQSYFNFQFKKATGTTPGQYRKLYFAKYDN
ncbi:MAG: helix-turn-helix transcriptional regulator [Clostridia bacterium]|nr:helix-turn-helix transcriptional regulator [Clostridia bacterium]